jgi:hypothetical protein
VNTLTRKPTPTYADLVAMNDRLKVELAKALAASIRPRNGENARPAEFAIDYGGHTQQTLTYQHLSEFSLPAAHGSN